VADIGAEEALLLSASVNNVTDNRVVTVDTVDDLPTLQTSALEYTFPSGSVFFVKSLNVLVVSCRGRWIGLDGRLLRSDEITTHAMGWGAGIAGFVGDGEAVTRSSPVSVAGGLSDWSQVSAGNSHSLGINNGTNLSWGSNEYGQLGTGVFGGGNSSPVSVLGGMTNWVQVSAGGYHSLGITSDSVAWAWGRNLEGQLATNLNQRSVASPISVVDGITNWSQVSAGGLHSLGIAGGVVWAWGFNGSGQLGDGTTVRRNSPVTVVGGITNWSQVSAGWTHNLGIANGVAWAWGDSTFGALGDDTAVGRSSPVSVVGGITNWSQVSAGVNHSLGIANGVAWAWGFNNSGRLGDGTTVDRSSPVSVIGGITNWSQVSAGGGHSLGIANGVAWAWGNGQFGQLGNNSSLEQYSPVSVAGNINTWLQVSAGSEHSLAIKA